MNWFATPSHSRWLETEGDRLLAFASASKHPRGGFAWLDEAGQPELDRPVELWISARMTHVFSLAHLMGRPGAGGLADHGVASLVGRFHDHEHGGWYASVGEDGPIAAAKTAYEHAFVILAAASATAAGRPGAEALLRDALAVQDRYFWDDQHGMVVEQWDRSFTTLDNYRGVNANMHTVEALLAAADVLGEPAYRLRALRIVTRIVHESAAANSWRIPEHYTPDWTPMLEYNHDEPSHPFRPYGATIGHAFEWARLALHTAAGLGDDAPAWLLTDAKALFENAIAEGWNVDGAAGFVYTTDWEGKPVVQARMHWVAAEAIATAAALHAATDDPRYGEWYTAWWDYAAAHLIDPAGSWRHELSPENQPSSVTWQGKPDVYHAFQATLIPRLPLAPTLAAALRDGLLA